MVGAPHYVQPLSTEGVTSEEVLALWREGKLWQRTEHLRKCAVCGKIITEGYVWDGTDTFCSEECIAQALDNDPGCVDILIDAGRVKWQEEFN
jgi:hypothetical protein